MAGYTTIDDSSKNFQVDLYTGTGSSLSPTFDGNSAMQPDFVWIKDRSAVADHALYDSSRGVQKQLESNTTAAGTTESTGLTAFGSDGFTVGGLAQVNTSSDTYVAWGWKANSGTRTTFTESGANPGGGYQVNTTAGFSIVDYTGTGSAGTISHGLTVAPEVIIVKNRGATEDWCVYHHKNTAAPETDFLKLNTDAATADATVWNDTAPTTSVFSVGTDADVNSDGVTYIAYCWAEVQGYSKFGGYTGNGDANGTFVYTGFKPAFVMFKRTSGTRNWVIIDNKRDIYNVATIRLFPDSDDDDNALANLVDFTSNGFKPRNTNVITNGSGDTYIYMAFAENPFTTSGGVPVTAR